MKGKNGFFVSPPARQYEKDGEKKYARYVQPAYDPDAETKRNATGEAYFDAILAVALERYEAESGGGGLDEPAPAPRAAAPTVRPSGRGPIQNNNKTAASFTSPGAKKLPF